TTIVGPPMTTRLTGTRDCVTTTVSRPRRFKKVSMPIVLKLPAPLTNRIGVTEDFSSRGTCNCPGTPIPDRESTHRTEWSIPIGADLKPLGHLGTVAGSVFGPLRTHAAGTMPSSLLAWRMNRTY